MTEPGDPMLPMLGEDIDLRTDLPAYRVWRDGGDMADDDSGGPARDPRHPVMLGNPIAGEAAVAILKSLVERTFFLSFGLIRLFRLIFFHFEDSLARVFKSTLVL